MTASALGTVVNSLRQAILRREAGAVTDGDLLGRFLTRRDEDAFESLLRRHGPMVLGVCRRVLRHQADAEDAFQATFLVLVRKAASIRPRSMVGNWLYGVALTTALKARAMNNKRVQKERTAAARSKLQVHCEAASDVTEHLDEALRALPDIYRSAIVLCDLEGQSHQEAARRLGCQPGTLAARLSRGRRYLARRLSRRGVMLPAGALATALASSSVQAVMPSLLVRSTLGHSATACVVSTKVAALCDAVIRSMLLARLKAMGLVLGMGLLIAGGGLALGSWVWADQTALAKRDTWTEARAGQSNEAQPKAEPRKPVEAANFIWAAAFLADGSKLALSEGSGIVSLWDVKTGARGPRLDGPRGTVRTLATSPDGRLLAGGGDEGTLFLWDAATGRLVHKLVAGPEMVLTVAFAPNGGSLATAGSQGNVAPSSVLLWDVNDGKIIQQFASEDGRVPVGAGVALAFRPDGKELAVLQTGQFNGVKLYDIATGRENKRLAYEPQLVPQSVAFSPDGRWLATGGISSPPRVPTDPRLFGLSAGHIKIWDLQANKLHQTLFSDSQGDVKAVLFSRAGDRLYAGTTVKLGVPKQTKDGLVGTLGASYVGWDTTTWKPVWQTQLDGGLTFGLALAPDGKRLAAANSAGCWLFSDAATGRDPVQLAVTAETPNQRQ